jgi:membrane associated rhomboid family serine protease
MNEITSFFLPLTFWHITEIALILIGAIILARLVIGLGFAAIAVFFGLIAAVIGAVCSRPTKRRFR